MRTMRRTDAPLRAARASLIVLLVPVLHGLPAHAAEPAGAEGLRYFREKIEPVLVSECYQCHSSRAEKLKGGLRLDSRARCSRGETPAPRSSRERSTRACSSWRSGTRKAWRCPPRSRSCPTRRSPTSRPGWRWGPRRRPVRELGRGKPGVGRGAPALGVPAGGKGRAAGGRGCGLGEEPRGRLRPGEAGRARVEARAAGRPGRMDPQGHVRPDRPPSDARGGRGVRGRHVARRR